MSFEETLRSTVLYSTAQLLGFLIKPAVERTPSVRGRHSSTLIPALPSVGIGEFAPDRPKSQLPILFFNPQQRASIES